jgi:betaine-aldehyde dehydrogenase
VSRRRVINPATGSILAELPQAGKQDIENTLLSARQAYEQGPWPKFSFAQRKNCLLKIAQGILDNAGELARLESENSGKPIKETTFMDIPSAAKTFEYFANNLERFLAPKRIALSSDPGDSQLLYEPRGVVLLIVPWNYPLLIASWKMAQALACANTVILKPSSLTPLTALKLAEIAKSAGLPEGVMNVINLAGEELGPSLCADARVDMISFTGSTETGREIMRFAASNTKKLIMELGGKSASIILADCDLETAVTASLTAIFLNQGQMCTAMSRILVDKKIARDFTEQFVQKAKRIKLGDGLNPETQMGPLISSAHRKRVAACVDRASKQGAKLLCGGKIPDNPELASGFFFEPTVFAGVSADMAIFQEEIFGPVVSISEFESDQEAIELANNSLFGLAGCIWSKNLEKAKQITKRINTGTVWINTYGMFHNEAPYGGFKQSGFGKELGEQGLLEYARMKYIHCGPENEPSLASQWYSWSE